MEIPMSRCSPLFIVSRAISLLMLIAFLSISSRVSAADQCDTTAQCQTLFGNSATDCANSRTDNSVCMCGSSACSNRPPPTPTPLPTAPPINPGADQCDTTAQCKSLFGNGATDCANSRSNNSVCMCGSSPCNNNPIATPRPTPSVIPTPQQSQTPISGNCEVRGTRERWHRVEVLCEGPQANEADASTFLNHRFNVVFTQNNRSFAVPGHFAADGNAERSGATAGNKWRAYFSPPTTGQWQYAVSFRSGNKVALDPQANSGAAVRPLDGVTGNFSVAQTSANGRDMKAKGLLQHRDGERYLRHAGSGSVFIEGGMDSPENIFGYDEFDNTRKFNNVGSCKGVLHRFPSHERDWNNGPTWGNNGRGKSLIGLINYISGKGVNGVYVMAMTVNGDGCDAHPWTDYSGNRLQYDVSKLDQWEIAFSHMNTKGLLIHFMTQETENDQLLDGGALGDQRKLYYREMISRFAHHPALQWNLGEENTNTAAQQKAFADYIKALDPYQHPVFMHTFPGQTNLYNNLLGHATFDGPTLQRGSIPESADGGIYGDTVNWLNRSQNAGRQWVVTATEASGGDAPTPNDPANSRHRIYWTWANVMAGGGGIEWYLKNGGSGHAYDLSVEDLREFDLLWEQTGHAVRFFNEVIPNQFNLNLQSFSRDNGVTSSNSDWVLADAGKAYILFLRNGGTTNIRLPNDDAYQVHWFNPRSGDFSQGNLITGSGNQSIGNAPSQTSQDWAVLVVNTNSGNPGGTQPHPDIVRVDNINPNAILRDPRPGWKDSYSVGDKCYCATTFDHDIGPVTVDTNAGVMTVREACERIGAGPGEAGRPTYNDVQCGNGPRNGQDDEDFCPGRVDIGKEGCGHIGPVWQVPTATPTPVAGVRYRENNGLIIMEAENTPSDLGLWVKDTAISGFTGSGYIEFEGQWTQPITPRSPLTYDFTVETGGLYYLHLYVARETQTVNGRVRTDVANDGFIRLEGDVGAGPNAGNSHGDDAPANKLTSDTKFYGGDDRRFAWATGNRLDLGGHNNKRVAVYNLQAGKNYRFVLSGRSKDFKVDRIVFRHQSVSTGRAQDTRLPETR